MTSTRQRRATGRNLHALDTVRAVTYERASLDATGERASVDRQRTANHGLCVARGWNATEDVVDNSFSAYDDDKVRPGWDRVLGMAERGEIDVIVAWHLDRVTRSMKALERLIEVVERTGVGIATATGDIDLSTDSGRMVARILTAVARAEVERKSARQILANDSRAEAGLPDLKGARPFGYEDDHVTIREGEADALRWAANMAIDGMPCATIGRELGVQGFGPSRNGNGSGFTGQGLRRMLINPRYVGLRTLDGDVVGPAVWEPILDNETHDALVRKLTDPARVTKPGGGKAIEHPLSKLIYCAACDLPMTAATVSHGRVVYRCKFGHVNTPRDLIEREVAAFMIALLSKPKFLATLAPDTDKDARKARVQRERLAKRLDNLTADNKAGLYDEDPENYREQRRELVADIKALQAVIDDASNVEAFAGFDFRDVAASWDAATFDAKRAMIARLIKPKLVRQRAGRGSQWTAEDCLTVLDATTGEVLFPK